MEVTVGKVMKHINKRCKRPESDWELPGVEKAVKNVRIKLTSPGAEPRIITLGIDYKQALEFAGYPNFPQNCSKLVIGYIFDRPKPPLRKVMMAEEFEKQDSSGLRKRDFRSSFKKVVRAAQDDERANARRLITDLSISEGIRSICRGRAWRTSGTNKTYNAPNNSWDKSVDENLNRDREPSLHLHREYKKKGEHHYVTLYPPLQNNEELHIMTRSDKGQT